MIVMLNGKHPPYLVPKSGASNGEMPAAFVSAQTIILVQLLSFIVLSIGTYVIFHEPICTGVRRHHFLTHL